MDLTGFNDALHRLTVDDIHCVAKSGRRLAYAGAIGGAAVAAGTAATVMIVHRSRRRAVPATG